MEENKYRYNDISERLRRMNRIYMGATIFMAALILLYLWMKQMNHNIKTVTVYGNTVLLLAFTVVNAVIYCRNKATSKLKVAVTMEMGIEYLLIGMQTDAHFITYILIVSLALQIPYYDKKGLRRTSIGLGILYILVTVVQSVKGINVIDVDTICGIWGVLGILFIIVKIGDITIMFNDDALGSIAEEHEKEKRVLEGVLGISQSIQTESVKSRHMVLCQPACLVQHVLHGYAAVRSANGRNGTIGTVVGTALGNFQVCEKGQGGNDPVALHFGIALFAELHDTLSSQHVVENVHDVPIVADTNNGICLGEQFRRFFLIAFCQAAGQNDLFQGAVLFQGTQ